ncbi:GTPase IMAP family member 1 isoform X3 [Patella vulgata]|nr:GTPase IMAP family member 1 isoform X3 [Patella vulgata]XP_050412184.1 GTPase IMAP family member 1 isoform X3 [Patella vulgata]
MVIRMVLIGESGTGKSYTANSILGKSLLRVSSKGVPTTKSCTVGETDRFGTKFKIVDTPGFLGGDLETNNHMKKIVELTHPGPQVFLFTFNCGSLFCENDLGVINLYKEYFGDDIYNHGVVLFTQKNSKFCKGTPSSYIRSSPKALRELVESCGNRVAQIDNAYPADIDVDVRNLISIVVDLVNERDLRYLTLDSVNNNHSDGVNSLNVNVGVSQTRHSGSVTSKNSDSNKDISTPHVKGANSSPKKPCLMYNCSDELVKQQMKLLGDEMSKMSSLEKRLKEKQDLQKLSSSKSSDVVWYKMVDDGISLITQFNQCIKDIFEDDAAGLLPNENVR